MASTKFYLDLRGNAKDGKGSILISIFHNKSTATIPTGVRVAQSEWADGCIVNRIDSAVLNANLSRQKADIDRSIAIISLSDNFDMMTAVQIKHEILKKNEVVDKYLVSEIFDEYIDTGMSAGTKDIYLATKKKVLTFSGPKLRIDGITVKWLYDFDKFLSQTQGVNGKSMFLRSLRAVCNYACRTGITNSYSFSNFKIKQEATKKRCISVEALREFKDCPTTKQNAIYRDYFFLMFYLIGINTVDLLLAKKNQLVNGRLEYIRTKTGKPYSVKIEPEAFELINRYQGKGEYLLDAMDHCKYYRSFAHEINDALKQIGYTEIESIQNEDLFSMSNFHKVIKPVIPDISTYYARHTWATFAHKIGISTDIISQALGHSFGNRTTLIYIEPDQEKVDIANRKVIDYFLIQS